MSRTWFAVGDVSAHDGHVTSVDNDRDWTYQSDVTGAHGTVLYEGATKTEACRVLNAWLVCDAPEKGTWIHAVPMYLPGVPVPSTAQLTQAARRQAREDRAIGYRVLPAYPAPSVAPWSGA